MPNVDLTSINPREDFIYELNDPAGFCSISKEEQEKVESMREHFESYEAIDVQVKTICTILHHDLDRNLLVKRNVQPTEIKMNTLRPFAYIL